MIRFLEGPESSPVEDLRVGWGSVEVQSFPAAMVGAAAPPGIAWVTYRAPDVAAARAGASAVGAVVDQGPGWFLMAGLVGERLEVTEVAW